MSDLIWVGVKQEAERRMQNIQAVKSAFIEGNLDQDCTMQGAVNKQQSQLLALC